MSLASPDSSYFIRGVNIGGWLVMERYITPYSFAVTDCHQRGDYCWYPGQIDAPANTTEGYKVCNVQTCNAVLSPNVFNKTDYPMDEWHLGEAFADHPQAGEEWLNFHFDNFVTKQDILDLKEAGITHLRVPLPHWIVGDVRDNEPWIVGDRWKYFVRLCKWVREIGGMEIWPNIHTAPGSQNGFDNSGIQNTVKTCGGWNNNPENVQRSLDVLLEVAVALRQAEVLDVVTGFGLLNEPFGDCNTFVYQKFVRDGITIMRRMLGPDFAIYVSDLFQANLFNDGEWGLDEDKFHNTFLDSHYYNIFSPEQRKMSPQEHVDQVCHPEKGQRVVDCCFEDPKENTVPSRGMQRIVAEWSGSFDAMPGEVLKPIMKSIYEYGVAPLMDRQLSQDRMDFLKQFIEAQIVSYEAAESGVAHGWFYWNFKMEGGAYAEWDMLRGIKEGWFPEIAPPDVPSETIYGSCSDIQAEVTAGREVIHTYPWLDPVYWRGWMVNETDTIGPELPVNNNNGQNQEHTRHKTSLFHGHHLTGYGGQFLIVAVLAFLILACKKLRAAKFRKSDYVEILA